MPRWHALRRWTPRFFFWTSPPPADPVSAAAFDMLIRTLRDALGFTVFLVTHDLDTLYTICDRVAVLAERRMLVTDTLENVQHHPNTWIQEYFNGPRGRAAHDAQRRRQENV